MQLQTVVQANYEHTIDSIIEDPGTLNDRRNTSYKYDYTMKATVEKYQENLGNRVCLVMTNTLIRGINNTKCQFHIIKKNY